MPKKVLALSCLVLLIGCIQTPRLPVFLSILVENGTPSNPSVCPNGIQLTLSKGLEIWTSPMVTNGSRYSIIDKPISSERQFVFLGDTKLTVAVSCGAGNQIGSVKGVNQTLDIFIDGSRVYEKIEPSPPFILEISPEVLPLPKIYFGSA
jgi:hypothetical protein